MLRNDLYYLYPSLLYIPTYSNAKDNIYLYVIIFPTNGDKLGYIP